jgi:hypothetical protein
MSRWPTAADFVSWLALCPDNDISGGNLLWREHGGSKIGLAIFIPHGGLLPAS